MRTNVSYRFAFVTALVVLVSGAPSWGLDFEKGKLQGSWDTTITFGVGWRLDDPDPELIGLVNGGRAYSVNGDDGDLNYETGVYSLTPKITSELGLGYGWFGLFVRGTSFYDFEAENGDRARTALPPAALDRVGSRTELLDAYLRASFKLGGKPAEIRAGEQVLSWGESTFIQNGINTINPVEVSALRVPGAELREALLPVGLVWANFSMTKNTSIEAFYQYDWEETKIDPPGSYFSTTDFAGAGGNTVFLGFGDVTDVPPFSDPTARDRPFLGVPRKADDRAGSSGQYGAALRLFLPALNDTELGFYYMKYHSRLPIISGRTGTVQGATNAGAIGAFTSPMTVAVLTQLGAALGDGVLTPDEINTAIGAGVAAGGASVPLGAALGVSGSVAQTFAGVFAATSDPAAASLAAQQAAGRAGTAFATDAYARTARYFLEYPEDIELLGASFNTQVAGIALQGEVSYRRDAPLQVDDVELLFAALSPISPVLAGTSGIPGEPGASQLGKFFGRNYATQFETDIPGFILRDVMQYQATVTKIFGPGLGADQSVLVGELALTQVLDMPGKNELRLEGPATYVSGNVYHQTAANPGASHAGKPAEDARYFADATSWGYRIVGRLDFENAIGAIKLAPRLSWQHDVSGNSPSPGGNFVEDRKAITIGLALEHQSNWSGDLSYTSYFGAGRHNLINDRDFIGASVKYSF
jgi:hypothetical protein